MKEKLKNIADVITGTLFRSKVRNDPDGDLKVIQLRDVANGEITSYDDLFKVKSSIHKEILLENGDLIFTAKTIKHNSIYIEKLNTPVTVTSHFLIIRVKNKKEVNPKYISWFINQKTAQNYLNRLNQGNMIPSINKEMLRNLVIPMPEGKIQENIVNIDDLLKRELSLIEKYKNKKQLLIQSILSNLLKKEKS